MSDLEKTGNKLLASIRKTKAVSDTAVVKAAKKKTASKTTKQKKANSAVLTGSKKRIRKAISIDNENPYPDGSRVWPD